MSKVIPKSHQDLLQGPIVVSLATLMPDGFPQTSAVWCTYDGTHLLMFTLSGYQKEKNMRARPEVSVLAVDPENPYRYIEVRGRVVSISAEGALQLADELTQLYENKPTYYGHIAPVEKQKEETPVLCQIEPVRVRALG
jgi:PPOX class probable F420-dependent enzyme|tara:strand:- start:2993 stop:3409 length:417 start_codon:yes stop_codon:yes gene_type:complete